MISTPFRKLPMEEPRRDDRADGRCRRRRAIGQSARMASISFCAAIHWSRGSRGPPLVPSCDRCDAAAPRSRRPSTVFFALWRTNWSQRSASCQGKGEERHTDHFQPTVHLFQEQKAKARLCKISVSYHASPIESQRQLTRAALAESDFRHSQRPQRLRGRSGPQHCLLDCCCDAPTRTHQRGSRRGAISAAA